MKRLHIGCGEIRDVDPDGVYLDKRPLFGVTYVQDASDLSNIEDETFDEIVTKDCLEHISFRKTKDTLKEWLRVLKPQGKITIEVPSAEQLLMILTAPNQPGIGREENESDFEFFSRVCFGHQDYPENSHLAYFKEEWLMRLLYETGFTDAVRVETTHMRIKVEARKC